MAWQNTLLKILKANLRATNALLIYLLVNLYRFLQIGNDSSLYRGRNLHTVLNWMWSEVWWVVPGVFVAFIIDYWIHESTRSRQT